MLTDRSKLIGRHESRTRRRRLLTTLLSTLYQGQGAVSGRGARSHENPDVRVRRRGTITAVLSPHPPFLPGLLNALGTARPGRPRFGVRRRRRRRLLPPSARALLPRHATADPGSRVARRRHRWPRAVPGDLLRHPRRSRAVATRRPPV